MPVSPVIFRNQFENTVSPFGWSNTFLTAGCSVTTEAVRPHHGAYNFKAYVPAGTAAGAYAIVYYGSLANAYRNLFVRAMNCQLDVLPEDDTDAHYIMGFWQDAGANNICRAGMIRSGANYRWVIRYRSLAAFSNVLGSNTPAVNTLYCVELEVLISTVGNADGRVSLWIDGNLECQALNLDNDDRNLNYLDFGLDSVAGPDLSNLNFRGDCVALSRMRIRCETFMMDLKGRGGDERQKTKMLSTVR